MEMDRFDHLARTLSTAGTRRGLLSLLLALPFAGALLTRQQAVVQGEGSGAVVGGGGGRRRRRHARHRHQAGDHKDHRKGQRKGKRKKTCTPKPVAEICAGQCAIVTNNCGRQVDCGPCTCATGCSACQTCNAATGLCVPVVSGTPCDDGNACTQTDTCQGGVCVGSNPVVCGGNDICCNGSCCPGCCGSNGTCGTCLVFVTSTVHSGALGGLDGADAICQHLADHATPTPLPGTYKAWLSDDTDSPATRFRQSALGYTRVDGEPIAANWADLTDGGLGTSISFTELNTLVDAPTANTWTHTLPDGTAGGASGQHCSNWSNVAGPMGDVGDATNASIVWTEWGSLPCSTPLRLYCFQQS